MIGWKEREVADQILLCIAAVPSCEIDKKADGRARGIDHPGQVHHKDGGRVGNGCPGDAKRTRWILGGDRQGRGCLRIARGSAADGRTEKSPGQERRYREEQSPFCRPCAAAAPNCFNSSPLQRQVAPG